MKVGTDDEDTVAALQQVIKVYRERLVEMERLLATVGRPVMLYRNDNVEYLLDLPPAVAEELERALEEARRTHVSERNWG